MGRCLVVFTIEHQQMYTILIPKMDYVYIFKITVLYYLKNQDSSVCVMTKLQTR